MPKKIDPAVKERVVRRVLEHRAEYSSLTAAAAAVAKIERLGTETVRRWVLQAEVDAGERPGTSSTEHAEIKRLKAENARLREDVAILSAATTFFAGALDPRTR
jgi:transposase-like protein